jgi:ABC-type dipeptide/oligopeptide/nickel transport system permease component
MSSVLSGDLGQSLFLNESVSDILFSALPWSLFVLAIAIGFSNFIGIVLGAAMAYKQGSRLDSGLSTVGSILNSIPYYVMALGMLYILGYQQDWFPITGRYSAGNEPELSISFLIDALHHAALPASAYIITAFGGVAILMRGNSISVIGADYLRVGRLRGLSSRRLSSRYVIWNSVLPMYTRLLLRIGFMFSGAVVLERIFLYRGIGWYLFQGIQQTDYPVMMGSFVVLTIAIAIAIFIADVTYSLIDPRAGETEETHGNTSVIRALLGVASSVRRSISGLTSRIRRRQSGSETPSAESGNSSIAKADDYELTETDLSKETTNVDELRAIFFTLMADWRARIGLLILTTFALLGTVGVSLVSEPTVSNGPYRLGPFQNWSFPLGTTGQGESMLSALIYSIPPLAQMIFAGAFASTAVGSIVGTVSGYVGGTVDRVVTTLTDVMIALPGLPLLIVLSAVFQPRDPWQIGLILAVPRWAGLARTIRSEVLSLRGSNYVEASRVMGISTPGIVTRDILPNVASYITIKLAFTSRAIIFNSVALYFLGVLPFSSRNWGVMLNRAYNQGALQQPDQLYRIFEPMLAIIILTLGFVFLAQALDRIFNPRIRSRHLDDEDTSESPTPTESPAD